MRKRTWTEQNMERASHVIEITNELREWYPLTLRRIYYRLLSKSYFQRDVWLKNDRKEGKKIQIKNHYNTLSSLIKWMRIDEKLSWYAIEDRTRTITAKRGFDDLEHFLKCENSWFLTGYSRCLIQGQENHVEVRIEKDGLLKIFKDITDRYRLRSVICKGYQSVSFTANFYRRAEAAIKGGQQPVVLYFGDLDPSGADMFEAAQRCVEKEPGLTGVYWKRCALNPNQVSDYNLPTDPTAAKVSDKRYNKYKNRYGDLAVEPDAFHPRELSETAGKEIGAYIDMDFFRQQQEVEISEIERIRKIRPEIIEYAEKQLATV